MTKKVKRSIQNPFGDLPEPIQKEELTKLVELLKEGKEENDTIARILMGHLRLIISLVAETPQTLEHLTPDLISQAVVVALEAIYKAKTLLRDNNITPYIVTYVRGKLIDFTKKQYGNKDWKREIETLPTIEQLTDPHFDEKIVKPDNSKIRTMTILPSQMSEILELIERAILLDNNLKRQEYKKVIVRLKASGYDNNEIADILEISTGQVSKLLIDIEHNYNELEKS